MKEYILDWEIIERSLTQLLEKAKAEPRGDNAIFSAGYMTGVAANYIEAVEEIEALRMGRERF